MILGTAGHVDHGKTALVQALTGIDTDRLPEEKKRGMTLELGFAHLTLESGLTLGVIDVPGHERFVKAMIAGAGGVDVAMLIVAVDEGVMPQTREHIDICSLLGVRAGLVVLTKSDLLPALGPEWLPMVEADIREAVRGSVFEDAPVLRVSARTGDGLPALKSAIAVAVKQLQRVGDEGPLFLPIDRAFSVKGFGCVVTGTVRSGSLSTADVVALVPSDCGPLRIRGLQVHGQSASVAHRGSRVAVNLAGVEADAVARGGALVRQSELPAVQAFDARVTLLASVERPLARRSRQLLGIGTDAVDCVVTLLGVDEVRPGESALAQVRVRRPIAAMPQQRFVLRGTQAQPGRGATLGGGVVLTLNPRRKRRETAQRLQAFETAEPLLRAQWLIEESGYAGLGEAELPVRLSTSTRETQRLVEQLLARGLAVRVDAESRRLLAGSVFTAMGQRVCKRLEGFHAEHPDAPGMNREEMKQRVGIDDERTFSRVVSTLVAAARIELKAEVMHLPGRGREFDEATRALKASVAERLKKAQLAPPTPAELALALRLTEPRVVQTLQMLADEGTLVRAGELFFDAGAVAALQQRLEAHFSQHPQMSTQQFKELTGQTRKFTIPLAEYFDAIRLTLRVGEVRVWRQAKN